jgi:rod shape-determining protein MreD
MKWLIYLVCAAAVVIIQTNIAPRLMIWGGRPEFCFILAVFFGLHRPAHEAALAGLILGLTADLHSVERLGVLTICLGLISLIVGSIRDYVFTTHPVTHFWVTMVVTAIAQSGLLLYAGATLGYPVDQLGIWMKSVVWTSVYTGLAAVPTMHVFWRLARWAGMRAARYSHSGIRQIAGQHV